MRITGQGSYEDKSGNKNNIIGKIDLYSDDMNELMVKGSIDFGTFYAEYCDIIGRIKGNIIKFKKGKLSGTVNVSEIECDELSLSGNVSCEKLRTKNARITLNSSSHIGDIESENYLQVLRQRVSADVDLDLEIPFLKLKIKTSGKKDDSFYDSEKVVINVINAKKVDLHQCSIGLLECTGGKLMDCHVDTLVCTNDIELIGDCKIQKRR